MPNAHDRKAVLRAGVPEALYRRGEKIAEKEGLSFDEWVLSLCAGACDASDPKPVSRKGKRSA